MGNSLDPITTPDLVDIMTGKKRLPDRDLRQHWRDFEMVDTDVSTQSELRRLLRDYEEA